MREGPVMTILLIKMNADDMLDGRLKPDEAEG